MKKINLFILILFSFSLQAQQFKDKEYIPLSENILTQSDSTNFSMDVLDYALCQYMNMPYNGLTNRREQDRIEANKNQMFTKTELVKTQYLASTQYPDKISDGWHVAITTDNINFCNNAKILIENNQMKEFVIENSIPVKFSPIGEIKKAKGIVSLKNFKGEEISIIEVYFIYDVEHSTIAEKPIKPGCVCFWSDLKSAGEIILKVNDLLLEPFPFYFGKKPDVAFKRGMICKFLKPAFYELWARGKGPLGWNDSFEIKSGYCLKYRLGR